jgi:hypothetical protein
VKPVDQVHYEVEDPLGDCLAACVASIFEWPLERVPDFMGDAEAKGTSWLAEIWSWAYPLGIVPEAPRQYSRRRKHQAYRTGYYVGIVESRVAPDGKSQHAVVMCDDKVVHDPNPLSRAASGTYWLRGDFGFLVWDFARLLPPV